MVDSLHNLISAQQDNMIEDLTFANIAKPTAAYVIDRRSTRVPFLAPQYSPQGGVSVARCVIAESGLARCQIHLSSGPDQKHRSRKLRARPPVAGSQRRL